MRAIEIISELTVGRIATGGITPQVPKSIYNQNAKLAYNIVKDVMTAPTAKEKFEILFNLKAGNTTNIIRLLGPNGKKYSPASYDKETGIIKLVGAAGDRSYSTSVDNLEFKGKERTISSTKKYWNFSFNDMKQDKKPEVSEPGTKRGRPRNPTPSSTAPLRLW
jgi:hypothetical protein